MRYKRASWIVFGIWIAVCLLTIDYNGPFFDEAIYVTAGQRTLEGYGLSDRYLTWFSGSLLWPALAGIGYQVGGFVGARVMALIVTAITFAAIVQATANLFGEKASFWTAVALALNGPLLALARLAVYDVLSLAGIAVSFWAVTESARRDKRGWVVLAAAAFVVGLFAKYPMGVMLLPILAILVILRKRKAWADIGIFGLVSVILSLPLYLPVGQQIFEFFGWRLGNQPLFGVTSRMIAYAALIYSAVPLLLAAAGWVISKGKRWLASVMLLSLAIWPAYHLVMQEPVSINKHLVFGFLFAYPLAGLPLAALWGNAGRAQILRRIGTLILIAAMASIALIQVVQSNRAWPDARPAADYLVEQVEPGQQLLINESWPYIMALYGENRINAPWDVYDIYRVTHPESEIDLCAFDWFVDSRGSYTWPEEILDNIEQCGTYVERFNTVSMVTGLGQDLNFVTYPVEIVVWQNTGAQ